TRAESLRAPIEAAARAEAERSRAAELDEAATGSWRDADGSDLDVVALRALVDELTGDLSRWAEVARLESELQGRTASLTALREAVAGSEQSLAELDARRAAVPPALEALDVQLAALAEAPVVAESARAAHAAAEAQLAAAREAEALLAERRTADEAQLAASDAATRASATVTALLRRRLAGYAGELAAGLVTGEPCAVCGSLEHPAPAPHADDPVDDAQFEAAERARDAAAEVERAAAAAASAARAAHAAALARAQGLPVAELEEAVTGTATARALAVADLDRRTALQAQREELARLDVETAAERERLVAVLVPRREELAVGEDRVAATAAIVEAARGEAATVAARISAVTVRRDLARGLVASREALDARTAIRDATAVELDARVAASDFADAAAVGAALLSETERSLLEEALIAHEADLRAVRSRLSTLELELAGEPEQPVDLTASQEAVRAAAAAVQVATTAAERVAQAAQRLRALAERIDAAHASIAERSREHDVLAGLADAIAGRTSSRMDLETFVLAAELEEIVVAANLRLSDMSSGRYRLRHSDAVAARNAASGLGIEIVDSYTGRARPAQSLSGGETFLASLALALGLAEVVTARAGGLRLDTLFIDEGFGSLDGETLELAMATLDELRQGGRTVGVISHVEAMKEQLPAQVTVIAAPHGPSTIGQNADARAAV
ncbi:SbcC/MukB-like Walker B domain-containing protein, partial [Microbacterium fluvii]|uniref:SbcC/MukB-like Walker B domain-containing protein n=1 Tax=Microbacterium fluvii TaxID=415215 RepID=UPI0031E7463B